MRKYLPESSFQYIFKLVIFFLFYFFSAKIGLSLHAVHTFATLIWLPTGIALGALILYGYNLWPAILLGAFAVNLTSGASFFVACGIALGNTLEAVVGTYLLRRYITLYRCFERLQDTLGFIGLCALGATLLSATIGTVCLIAGHVITVADFSETWFVWWVGDALGALVVTPFMLTCFKPTRPWNADSLSMIEIVSFFFILFSLNYIIFWHSIMTLGSVPLVYLISLPLLWGGLRLGSRGMTFSIFITSLMAVIATVLGHGPFVQASPSESLLFLQIFIGTISITFLIFLSVVKERKHATQGLKDHIDKLEKAVQQISSADQAKNNFLAILAHELRNPLAPLLSSIELLKIRTKETVDAPRIVKSMNTHIHTMARLLDDLLDISKISREEFALNIELFSIQEVVNQAIESVTPLMKKRNLTFSVYMPKKIIRIMGDPLRVEQMIVNILNNAAKYTQLRGTITLTVSQTPEHVSISVKDNGIGIAPHMLSQIFEPFLQINKEHALTHGGLGIGLSLTKKLARLHKGSIVAESEGLGKGSTFTLSLPHPKNSHESPLENHGETKKISKILTPSIGSPVTVQNAPKKTVIPEKKKTQIDKILIVDDNKPAAQGLKKLLEHKKYTIDLAYDSSVALKKVKTFSPDIILLDIGLPIMDGYEVARRIRETEPGHITLIALTGYGQDDDKKKAAHAGFDYHLTKPVSIGDIEKILLALS